MGPEFFLPTAGEIQIVRVFIISPGSLFVRGSTELLISRAKTLQLRVPVRRRVLIPRGSFQEIHQRQAPAKRLARQMCTPWSLPPSTWAQAS